MKTKEEIGAQIRAFSRELAAELGEISWEQYGSPFAALGASRPVGLRSAALLPFEIRRLERSSYDATQFNCSDQSDTLSF